MTTSKRFVHKLFAICLAIFALLVFQTTVISADSNTVSYQPSQSLANLGSKSNTVPLSNPEGTQGLVQENANRPVEEGKPVKTVSEAQKRLLYIIAAEGLHPSRVTYTIVDTYGNYYFDVWYKDFPHNTRVVTKNGDVLEDEDSGNTPVLPQNQE
jgi:hypothetical protein